MIQQRNLKIPNASDDPNLMNLSWLGGSFDGNGNVSDNFTIVRSLLLPFDFTVYAIMLCGEASDATGTGIDFELDVRKATIAAAGFTADYARASLPVGNTASEFIDLSGTSDADGQPIEAPYDASNPFTVMRARLDGAFTTEVSNVQMYLGIMGGLRA